MRCNLFFQTLLQTQQAVWFVFMIEPYLFAQGVELKDEFFKELINGWARLGQFNILNQFQYFLPKEWKMVIEEESDGSKVVFVTKEGGAKEEFGKFTLEEQPS